MESSKKQTLFVEVMPLLGGHLALPRVRLSKYIPAASTGAPGSTPLSTPSADITSPFANRGTPFTIDDTSGQSYKRTLVSNV
jgi:hypothetical protein